MCVCVCVRARACVCAWNCARAVLCCWSPQIPLAMYRPAGQTNALWPEALYALRSICQTLLEHVVDSNSTSTSTLFSAKLLALYDAFQVTDTGTKTALTEDELRAAFKRLGQALDDDDVKSVYAWAAQTQSGATLPFKYIEDVCIHNKALAFKKVKRASLIRYVTWGWAVPACRYVPYGLNIGKCTDLVSLACSLAPHIPHIIPHTSSASAKTTKRSRWMTRAGRPSATSSSLPSHLAAASSAPLSRASRRYGTCVP